MNDENLEKIKSRIENVDTTNTDQFMNGPDELNLEKSDKKRIKKMRLKIKLKNLNKLLCY